jgi:hypothetical protein
MMAGQEVGERVNMRRTAAIVLVLAACALPAARAAGQTAAAPLQRAERLSAARLGVWPGAIRDVAFPRGSRRLATARLAAAYGGAFTAHDGEVVHVFLSDAYPPDASVAQSWADLLSRFVHGFELGLLTVYVAPFDEVERICGMNADACYDPNDERLIAPGSPPPDGTPVEEIAAHEYGHHVARTRTTAAWDGYELGTRRWAAYEQICRRTRDGTAFPGDEGDNYTLNPGEAFAESFRQLNDDLGTTGGTNDWRVDPSFYPDATAEQLVRQDVVTPWQPTVVASWSGRFRRSRASTQRQVRAAVDGPLVATLVAPRGSKVEMYDEAHNLLATSTSSVSAAVCGDPDLTVVAVAGRTVGRYTVTVRQP